MVAPRTRADEPAQSTPAARPARKTSPRAASNGKGNGSSAGTATKANDAPNGVATAPDTAGNGSANGSAGVAPAPRPRRKDSPEAMGQALVASILRHDPDADVADVKRAIEFAIEAHGDARRASGEPFVTHPIMAAQILSGL